VSENRNILFRGHFHFLPVDVSVTPVSLEYLMLVSSQRGTHTAAERGCLTAVTLTSSEKLRSKY